MNFVYAFTVPAGTAAGLPYTQRLRLSYGVITHIQIVIPSGHAGKAHLTLHAGGFQLYPLSRGQTYHGDDVDFNFDDRFFLNAAPYELIASGHNTDADYGHEFLILINMLLPDQLGIGPGFSGMREIKDLVSKTITV